MDKATLLTASAAGPDFSLATDLSQIAPTLAHAVRLQRILGSISLAVCLRAYFLASTTLYASKVIAWKTYIVTCFAAAMSGKIVHGAWDSNLVRGLRRRAFDEFAAFILGSGNTVILMLFWPGWWVLAGTFWALWQFWW